MNAKKILSRLESMSDPEAVKGMARFGINPGTALGVPVPVLRKMAKETGKDHSLALELWASGIHEARILAGMVDDPAQVTPGQMDEWAEGFDSWDVCDQCCMNLFWLTPFAVDKCFEWSGREEEFVKRAGFALMARTAWSDRNATDEEIARFLPVIAGEAPDERNYVKKAVNWALRQIGKRNAALNRAAVETARALLETDSRSARWIAADALRELESVAVRKRLSGAG